MHDGWHLFHVCISGEAHLRVLQFIAATWLALACVIAPVRAEKRIALVIGNDSYANLAASDQLQKAVNDARAVGAALTRLRFEVMSAENVGRQALVDKLDAFTQRLSPGDTAFFFFSGHGVALGGINYILPSDIPIIGDNQEGRLAHAAFSEQDIVADLKTRGVRVAVVVLDACRNNPFGRAGGKGVGGTKGLAPPPQVQGVFSLYAAAAGQSARDRLYDGDPDPNSVFSRVLVPKLTKPGLDLRDLAYEVREEVARIARASGYDQRPASYDETVGGRIYLAGPPAEGQALGPLAPPAGDAAQAWRDIQGTTSLAVLDDFIARFGDAPIYGPRARERREEVAREQRKNQVAVVVAPDTAARGPLTAAQERALKPKDAFRECADCPEMVVVPAGSFTMGSPEGEKDRDTDEGPQHVVTISKPFAVGKLPVTVDQFDAFVRETGYAASSKCNVVEGDAWKERTDRSWRNPGFAQERSHPVVCVAWNDAKAYVEWMAKRTGKAYRLLSEAEWEYAARGQTQPGAYPRFWFGDDDKASCQNGNGADQKARDIPGWSSGWAIFPCNDGYAYTSPSGHYTPNAFGLYDMAGNVWQWTADCWHGDYKGAPSDGTAWTTGICSDHMARGGAWYSEPKFLRAAERNWNSSERYILGFRVARTLI